MGLNIDSLDYETPLIDVVIYSEIKREPMTVDRLVGIIEKNMHTIEATEM